MNLAPLVTANLELVPNTRSEVLAMVDAMSPSERAQVSADWFAQLEATGESDPWVHGFSAIHRNSGATVGSGGFKGPPAGGSVEIAYGTAADHRGNGYATEIAKALVGYAFSFADVDLVRAHTLPDSEASKRVLAKCGFKYVGEFIDADDGLVWRFEKRRGAPGIERQG